MTKWTAEDRDRVAILLRENRTSGYIASVFDVSRNSIISFVRRNEVLSAIGFDWNIAHPPRKGAPRRDKRSGAHKRKGEPRIKQSRHAGVLAAPKRVPVAQVIIRQAMLALIPSKPMAPPTPIRFTCRHILLMDLKRGDCKWPVNDAKPKELHLFCGNPAEADKPYCAGHAALSYQSRALDRRQA